MKVAIIGTGYVGLVTGAGLAQRGHDVVCHDVDAARLEPLKSGKAPFFEPGLDELLADVIKSKRFSTASALPDALKDADVSIIAVGTPSTDSGIDISYVRNAAGEIGRALPHVGRYHVVAVKSTVVPGTTDTAVRQTLEQTSGLSAGKDFGLGMVPEFLREGNAVEDTLKPDRTIIGAFDERSGKVLQELFAAPGSPTLVTSPRNAEMTKYASNALFATLISFSNEIAGLCEKVPGLSEEDVMAGLHLDRRFATHDSSRIGALTYLRGGIGFGGSCFPKDVKALREFAVGQNAPHAILDSILSTNESRAHAVLELLQQITGPVKGKRIAVAGLAFKENTDDVRESPGVRITDVLCKAGAQVAVHDPQVDSAKVKFAGKPEMAKSVEDALRGAEACVIATRWPQYTALNWQRLLKGMARPVILDGRQVVDKDQRSAPMIYVPIGKMPKN